MSSDRIVPSAGFRENPCRAIYIDQEVNQRLLRDVTLKHHELVGISCDPITVYICSPGGNVQIFEWIKDILWTPDQSGFRPRIITVAKGMAASAASRLLVLGDYSMSYPASIIHCHGTRLPQVDEVTRERAEFISRMMEDSNRATADEFVGRILYNLAFLFDSNRQEITKISKGNSIVAFSHFIESKLGPAARGIMQEVFEDLDEASSLNIFLNKPARKSALAKAEARGRTDYEKTLVKMIIDFLFMERWKNCRKLTDQFSDEARRLFKSHRHLKDNMFAGANIMEVIPLVLSESEFKLYMEANKQGTLDKFLPTTVAPLLVPLWQLASSISNRLVMGENPLSAVDAYWLGLIQEVVGSGLPCLRHSAETPTVIPVARATKKARKSAQPKKPAKP
jgi:ATP-dependent protease ClpP protease subunit